MIREKLLFQAAAELSFEKLYRFCFWQDWFFFYKGKSYFGLVELPTAYSVYNRSFYQRDKHLLQKKVYLNRRGFETIKNNDLVLFLTQLA